MRVLARNSATSGNTLTNIPASTTLSLIGPTLLLPFLTPTNGLRIVHAMIWFADPNATLKLFFGNANISIALAGPIGPLTGTRVRHYNAPYASGQGASSVGFRFGHHDPELIKGTDYREIAQLTPNATVGAFCISSEIEVVNTDVAAHNVQVGITVLYELMELESIL